MLSAEQIENKLNRILLRVQKPGRYVGGELNSIRKDWDQAKTKVALVFPDIYDIGVSNVGLKVLYDQINQRDDALAELVAALIFAQGGAGLGDVEVELAGQHPFLVGDVARQMTRSGVP